MSRFKIKVHETAGQARLQLMDGDQVLAVFGVPWLTYERAMRDVLGAIRGVVARVIAEKLGAIIWRDAQAKAEGSSELAKRRLEELGVTGETVMSWSQELAREVAQYVTGHLPEVVG